MPSHDSYDDRDSPDSERETLTPRGGFMARPGLKAPPRHAVVVRVGDAPESHDIPLARPSIPPPPPPSEPAAISASEKITVRAIPTPSSPPLARVDAVPPSSPPVVESLPPPSDAALVTSVREPAPSSSRSRHAPSPRWTIAVAAAAGLILGLASVATGINGARSAARAPIAAPTLEPARPTSAPSAALQPSASVEPKLAPPPQESLSVSLPPASRPVTSGAKRSIF